MQKVAFHHQTITQVGRWRTIRGQHHISADPSSLSLISNIAINQIGMNLRIYQKMYWQNELELAPRHRLQNQDPITVMEFVVRPCIFLIY